MICQNNATYDKMKQYERIRMNNYYESCLEVIRQCIADENHAEALTLLDQELSMPFIPQPYDQVFRDLRDNLRIDRNPKARYFESMEEVFDALKGNDALKQKALISLERMNLRAVLNDLEDIMRDKLIDDWLKKQLVFYLMEQNIDVSIDVRLNHKMYTLEIRKLKNPIGSEAYLQTVASLRDMLESVNPSLLMLCIDELDQKVLEAFPEEAQNIDAQSILDTVNRYLNQ